MPLSCLLHEKHTVQQFGGRLQRSRTETPLPQRPRALMAPVERPHELTCERLHHLSKRLGARRNEQQLRLLGEQRIGNDRHAMLLAAVAQSERKCLLISRIRQTLAARQHPLLHQMRQVRNDQTLQSCHEAAEMVRRVSMQTRKYMMPRSCVREFETSARCPNRPSGRMNRRPDRCIASRSSRIKVPPKVHCRHFGQPGTD